MKKNSKKAKILFYSDCPSFAGCENMLVSLLNNIDLHQEFDVSFAYRYSNQYQRVLRLRLNLKINEIPLMLPTNEILFDKINRINSEFIRWLLGMIVDCLCLKYWFFLYDVLILYFIFSKIKPDILHINNGGYPGALSCRAAIFAAKLSRVKRIIFVINNIIVPYETLSRRLQRPIDVFIKNNTDIFITGSKFATNKVLDLWRLPQEKVINIPNSILARPMVETKEMVLERLGIENGHIILGNVGLLEYRKGQKYLIEALAIVRDKFDNFNNVKLIIEGIGKERKNLENLVTHFGLGRNVIFIENEKNIFDMFNIFDLFCLPSIEYEDFPNVILEAMSLAKPVIGSRLAGIPEQIEDGINGFLVEPGDAKGLSDAILTLIQSEDKRMEMGRMSLERFQNFFSCSKIINKYICMYRNMTNYII